MKRRRYDTVELVAQIRKERRNGVLLASIGLGLIVFLLAVYLAGLSGKDLPVVPGDASPQRSSASPAAVPAPTAGGAAAAASADGAGSAAPGQAAAAGAEAAGDRAGPPGDADAPAPDAAQTGAAAAADKASVEITVQQRQKVVLWLDGNKVGKVNKHSAELPAGAHTIKAKLGRRTVEQAVEMEAGQRYQIKIDVKRRKIQAKVLP